MENLPTADQMIGNHVSESEFKLRLKQLIENLISSHETKDLIELMGLEAIQKSNQYSDQNKVPKLLGLQRSGILYEVIDSHGNETWLQISAIDGLPTPYAKKAIRESVSIDDSKYLILGDEPLMYVVEDSIGNPTDIALRKEDGQFTSRTIGNIKRRIGINQENLVLVDDEELVYLIEAKGQATAIAIRKSDGMFAQYVIDDIAKRIALLDPNEQQNLVDLEYRPEPCDFQIISSVARGIARHIENRPLPSRVTSLVNSTNQNIRFTFPNNYNDATPLILIICFEGIGDPNLDIRAAYSEVSNHGVIWARCDFHGNHYGNPQSMLDAKELYQKACEIAPIGGVVIVGNSMGGIAALNALTTGAVPNILGVYLTDPTFDLRQRYDNGRSADINAAYECTDATYAEKTKGHDPALEHWSKFKGVPIKILATSNDGLVTMQAHTNKLLDKLKNHNDVDVIDTQSAGHNSPEQFNALQLISFINKCVNGSVITKI